MKKQSSKSQNPKEVSIHYERDLIDTMTKVISSEQVAEFIKINFSNARLDYKEYFWVLSLSQAHHVLGASMISMGTVASTPVSIKEVVQIALLSHASAMIMVHNHPSGALNFSKSDILLTQRIKESLELIEVSLLDHVVITTEGCISMADEGLLIT